VTIYKIKHKQTEPTMDAKDVEVVSKKTLFKGYFQVDDYVFKHRLFEGGWGGEISREVLERSHAACCLLYDPDLNQLVFLEQFRQGAFAALDSRWYDIEKESPWLIEVVAGIIEYDEQPEDVARREAVE
jgi:ADP-ribose pyrophosphatase